MIIALSFAFPGGSDGKASAYNAGDLGSIPGLERSPGERNGNPLQYSCLENPMDGGAWLATVHGVAKCRTQLSNFTSLHTYVTMSLKLLLFPTRHCSELLFYMKLELSAVETFSCFFP